MKIVKFMVLLDLSVSLIIFISGNFMKNFKVKTLNIKEHVNIPIKVGRIVQDSRGRFAI